MNSKTKILTLAGIGVGIGIALIMKSKPPIPPPVVMVDPNGGTPAGTTVCYIPYSVTGTIVSWNGIDYRVNLPAWGGDRYIDTFNLSIGSC